MKPPTHEEIEALRPEPLEHEEGYVDPLQEVMAERARQDKKWGEQYLVVHIEGGVKMSAYATSLMESSKQAVVEEALRQRDRVAKLEAENAQLRQEAATAKDVSRFMMTDLGKYLEPFCEKLDEAKTAQYLSAVRIDVARKIADWVRTAACARGVLISINASQDLARIADAIERGEWVSASEGTRHPFGTPGVRDEDHPCDQYAPGKPAGSCYGDGHALCRECAEWAARRALAKEE